MRRKKKPAPIIPCMVIGPTTDNTLMILKEWKYAILASFYQHYELTRHGIIVTDTMDASPAARIAKAAELGYDPIYLAGPDWLANDYGEKVAPVIYKSKAAIMNLSGCVSTLLPQTSITKLIKWYEDGLLEVDFMDEISQQERAGRWMAARGIAMIQGEQIPFGDDWAHLHKVIKHLGYDADREVERVRRYYANSEDT